MRNSFPKIIYPYDLIHISKSKPILLKQPLKPELPIKDIIKKPDEFIEDSIGCLGYGVISLLICGFGMLLFNAGIEIGAFLFLFGGAMLTYYIFGWENIKRKRSKKKDNYLVSIREYEQKVREAEKNYMLKLTEFKDKSKSYDKDCIEVENKNLEMQSEKFLHSFIKRKFQSYFLYSKRREIIKSKIDKGVTHTFFKNYLSLKFPNQIFDDCHFNNPAYVNLDYIPDYVLYDENLNLHIDIEIDEPYIGNDGTPIHFGNDNERDIFFCNKKWLVIRFAEIQIIKYPKDCCDLISEVIENLKAGFILDISNQTYVKKIQSWSKDEAHKLAFEKYRDTYLPNELRANLNFEVLENDRKNLNPIPEDFLPF